ncbi:1,2-phenylacetyl-CoA epoxidase subunit PaaC [Rummeliibacillus sp. JY-2-4R]
MTIEKQAPEIELLFQLADDDFLFSYRGSEWLGLAPHIEEDVAFSSITQDTMGHATMFYRLLESLNVGDADALAHLRPVVERRNSILVERKNGEGTYLENPQYDWAYAVVRNYLYTVAKKVKIDSLKSSSNEKLQEAAVKISMELYYHLLHWKTWFVQLFTSTDEARLRMQEALNRVIEDSGDLFSFGSLEKEIVASGLIEGSDELIERWLLLLNPVFKKINIPLPELKAPSLNGRNGEHTDELQQAITTMSEVYTSNLKATW